MNSQQWVDRIRYFAYNPVGIMDQSLALVEECLDGVADIGEASNPFVLSIEAGAVAAAAAMQENAINTRKLYRIMAENSEDLYLHMSDKDYIGRFATPARATIRLFLGLEEIVTLAIPTASPLIRKVTIPRHTEITVNDIPFTMVYPIDIRVMNHGGLQIVYDTSSTSPFENVESNQLKWEKIKFDGIDFIAIDLPISQFKITSFNGKGNLAQNFVKRWPITDQFYAARAYFKRNDGTWHEMITTHTDQVFDPLKPTAILKYLGPYIEMSVPQIYVTASLTSGDYRLDVYTTKGPISIDLAEFSQSDYSMNFIDLEKSDNGLYTSIMNRVSMQFLLSDDKVEGGSDAMEFEELRERVIHGAQTQDIPISNVSMMDRLQRRGYGVVTDVDNVTNREILATRELPRPEDRFISSGAAVTIKLLSTTLDQLAALQTVSDNGKRVTILPETVYRLRDGILSIEPKTFVDSILADGLDARARRLNERQYLYTPFYYVLDTNQDWFDSRAYHLDDPVIHSKSFIEENASTGMQVSASAYEISKTANGYLLRIICSSSDEWKNMPDADVHCQLSFIPFGQVDRAVMNGVQVGILDDERIFEFNITTKHDIDEEDRIVLTSFSMYTFEKFPFLCPLNEKFDIIFAVSNYSNIGLTPSIIDNDLGMPILPVDAIGVIQERMNIELGVALKGLWRASRTVLTEEQYERYTSDVPMVYENTVFEMDPLTNTIKLKLELDGSVTYTVLHAKGAPILDGLGNPLMKHKAGEIKYDLNNKPILVNSRKLARHVDLLLVDGVFWFADETRSYEYRTSVPRTIVGWLKNDIADISRYLLEQTNLYYYPKSSFGHVPVTIKESQRSNIDSAQSFTVNYYLTPEQYRDNQLRVSLMRIAIDSISTELEKSSVTMNNIISRITSEANSNIVAVEVTGLGGLRNLASVQMVDDAARLTIKKIAVAFADGTLGVTDAVAVNFIQHTE